jgi:hypothetical protein
MTNQNPGIIFNTGKSAVSGGAPLICNECSNHIVHKQKAPATVNVQGLGISP